MRHAFWGLLAILASSLAVRAEDQVQIPWGNKFFVPKDPPPVVVHDFGSVPWGTTLTHRFVLTNIYAVPMQVMEDPKVSCGCVRIVRYTQKLEPREAGFVDIEMDGRRFQGAKAVTIQVRFGPKYQSTAVLQVRAFGRSDVQINPGQVNFGTVALGQQPAQTIDVTYTGQQINWQVTGVNAATAPSVNARVERVPVARGAGSTFRVTVALKPDAEPGTLQEQLLLQTSDANAPVLAIPVTGTLQAPLSVVQGPNVKLDPVPVGQETTRNIMIRGKDAFTIVKVEGEGDGLTASPQLLNASNPVHVVKIVFKPTQPGVLQRKLTFTTSKNETTTVTVDGSAVEEKK